MDSAHFNKSRSRIELAMTWPQLGRTAGNSRNTVDRSMAEHRQIAAGQKQRMMFGSGGGGGGGGGGAAAVRSGLDQRMPHEELLRRYWVCALDPLLTGHVITGAASGTSRLSQRLHLPPAPATGTGGGRFAKMQSAQAQARKARARVSALLRLCRAIDERAYMVGRVETALSAQAQAMMDGSVQRVRARMAVGLQAAVRGHLSRARGRRRSAAAQEPTCTAVAGGEGVGDGGGGGSGGGGRRQGRRQVFGRSSPRRAAGSAAGRSLEPGEQRLFECVLPAGVTAELEPGHPPQLIGTHQVCNGRRAAAAAAAASQRLSIWSVWGGWSWS
jgi:hypothetical protein